MAAQSSSAGCREVVPAISSSSGRRNLAPLKVLFLRQGLLLFSLLTSDLLWMFCATVTTTSFADNGLIVNHTTRLESLHASLVSASPTPPLFGPRLKLTNTARFALVLVTEATGSCLIQKGILLSPISINFNQFLCQFEAWLFFGHCQSFNSVLRPFGASGASANSANSMFNLLVSAHFSLHLFVWSPIKANKHRTIRIGPF